MTSMQATQITSLGRMSVLLTTNIVVLAFLILAIAPILVAVLFSFTDLDGSVVRPEGLDGYRVVLAESRIAEFWQVLQRAFAATAISVTLGAPTGFWLRRQRSSSLQLILLSLVLAPWLVSDMLRAFGWQLILSPDGPISTLWVAISGANPLEGLRYNHSAAILGLVSATLPVSILSIFVALPRPDSSEWLSAREMRSPQSTFALLVLGRAKLGLAFSCGLTFLICLFGSSEARFLDGPTQISVMTIASSLSNVGVSALMAFGVILLSLSLFVYIFLIFIWANSQKRKYKVMLPKANFGFQINIRRVLPPLHIGRFLKISPWAFFSTFSLVVIFLCIAPIFVVSIEAFQKPTAEGVVWTYDNFISLLQSTSLLDALGRSAIIAVVVAFVGVSCGFSLSLAVWNPKKMWALLLLMLGMVLLPGEVYSIGILQLAKAVGWNESAIYLVIIAHLIWVLPFATCSLMLSNAGIGRSIIEAALELGRSPVSVTFQIVSRISFGAIAAATLFAFTLSLNEGVRSTYLGGSSPSLANEVFGRLQSGLLPAHRAIFAIEFLLVVGALVSAVLIIKALSSYDQRPD